MAKRVLTAGFRTWLTSHDSEAIVGYAGSVIDCPLARYTKDVLGYAYTAVATYSYPRGRWYVYAVMPNGRTLTLPVSSSVLRCARLIDAYNRVLGTPITARMALDLLENQQ